MPTRSVTAASQSIPPLSGLNVVKLPSALSTDLSAYTPVSISANTYRTFTFSIRTTSTGGAGVALKVHDATNSADYPDTWVAYTFGISWTTGYEPNVFHDSGHSPQGAWATLDHRSSGRTSATCRSSGRTTTSRSRGSGS